MTTRMPTLRPFGEGCTSGEVRPSRPGNAGGGKGPDFWCAFEDGEVKVIGDEPDNTDYNPNPSEKAVPQGEGETAAAQTSLAAVLFSPWASR